MAAALPGPGRRGPPAAQRPGVVPGEPGAAGPGRGAAEPEPQEAAAGRPEAIGARPARRPGPRGPRGGDPGRRRLPDARGRPAPCSPSPASRSRRIAPRRSLALCRLPDPRAVSIYLAAIRDRDPQLRRAGESALLAIRDRVPDQLAVGRAVGRRSPVRRRCRSSASWPGSSRSASWRVIGPFPRTTPQVFLGEPAIDFARTHAGADGQIDRLDGRAGPTRRPVAWTWTTSSAGRAIAAAPATTTTGSPGPRRLRLRRGRFRQRRPGADAPGLERDPDRDRQREAGLRIRQTRRAGRTRPTPSWCGSAWPGAATGSWS